ncbi:MAG: UvrB/UvrC motif-containing protein, partial [Clostridiales Family XIII bacterium]|nr:UvrB/UvrC motif-containing protein [Clostridiales Family XIII bacterium]
RRATVPEDSAAASERRATVPEDSAAASERRATVPEDSAAAPERRATVSDDSAIASTDEIARNREALHTEYMEDIGKIIAFLKGHSADVEKYIAARMNEASERMDYEEAARWRDYLASAKSVTEKQRVELLSSGSMDIVLGSVSGGGGDAQASGTGNAQIPVRGDARVSGTGDSQTPEQGNAQTSGSVMPRTVTVFFVRDGKLVGRERHLLDIWNGDPDSGAANGAAADGAISASVGGASSTFAGDAISASAGNTSSTSADAPIRAASGASATATVAAFISQYYANQSQPPKEILLEAHIPDEQLIADALTDAAGYKVKILVPERGAKKDLIRLAQSDVSEAVRREEQRRAAADRKRMRLREQFTEIFGDAPMDQRVEAYDISHTGGVDSVGAMVVFTDGKPDKSSYRRFKIRGETHGDDYAAMQEVLYRRLRRGLEDDKSFLPLPGLVLIDGGKGHVTAALQVIDAMSKSEARGADLSGIRVAGMVKDDHHRTRALVIPAPRPEAASEADSAGFTEYDLKEKTELLHLTAAIQEEVHRFAIEYHRKRRNKRMIGEE